MQKNLFKTISFSRYYSILFGYSICLFLWEWLAQSNYIPQRLLPPPSKIVFAFVEIIPEIITDILFTIYASATGLFISIFISIILSVLMELNGKIKEFLLPIIVLTQAIPIIVLAPLFAMWFGFGLLPKILIVIIVCVFPLLISLYNGMNSTDKEMVQLMRIMGASNLQIIRHVRFPNSLIDFFSGLQIAATYSVIGAIIGEWMGGDKGLGLLMLKLKRAFQYDKVFAVILITIIITLLYWAIILIIQRISIPWKYKK